MPVPQQLTHIAIFRTGYPDSWKAIFHHQFQQQLRILAVGLLLLDAPGLDLRGIADPHFETQRLWHQALSRRSQNGHVPWARMHRLIANWLRPVRIYHPYRLRRMGVIT